MISSKFLKLNTKVAKKRNILSQKLENYKQNLKVSSKAKVYIYQYFNLFVT